MTNRFNNYSVSVRNHFLKKSIHENKSKKWLLIRDEVYAHGCH